MINNYLLRITILVFLLKFKANIAGLRYPETGESSGIEVKMLIGKSIIQTLLAEMRLIFSLTNILWDLLTRCKMCWVHSSWNCFISGTGDER